VAEINQSSDMIFHIVRRNEWHAAQRRGSYAPDSIRNEGFVHCSSIEQVVETANLFYRSQRDLILLCIVSAKLAAPLRWEAGAGRTPGLFPHIYGPLNLAAVSLIVDFPCDEGGSFTLPIAISNL
jgi:uncharacterized protein (DUF952 family)